MTSDECFREIVQRHGSDPSEWTAETYKELCVLLDVALRSLENSHLKSLPIDAPKKTLCFQFDAEAMDGNYEKPIASLSNPEWK
jgi:hypothetical protein